MSEPASQPPVLLTPSTRYIFHPSYLFFLPHYLPTMGVMWAPYSRPQLHFMSIMSCLVCFGAIWLRENEKDHVLTWQVACGMCYVAGVLD